MTKTLSEHYSLDDTMKAFKQAIKNLGRGNVSFETTRTGYRIFAIVRSTEADNDTNLLEREENEEKFDENTPL